LVLYLDPACPYCRNVLQALAKLDLQVEQRDITRDPEFRRELAEARGRTTVPVLKIEPSAGDGPATWMPESLDIIRELRRQAGVPVGVPAWVDRGITIARPVGLVLVVAAAFVGGPAGNWMLGLGIVVVVVALLRRLF
jgi:glutaredoxin